MGKNKEFRDIPANQKVIFLPQCLRSLDCKAKTTEDGVICINCGKCSIGPFKKEAESFGYKVFIAPGSSLVKNIVKKFKKDFKSQPADIKVGVGPGIEKKCYEVGGEFLDLRELANEQLLEEGIKAENIENMNLCTKCHSDKFFSYRGGDGSDRFVTAISLV